MAEDAQIPYNCVAWTLLEGYPWSPVYVFDPNQVRENLELLGNSHQHHLKKARDWPNVYRLVYNFGYHNISLLSLGQYIKPWQCPDHLRFLNGYPHECMNRRDVVEAFREALIEAQNFLGAQTLNQYIPYVHASDLSPTTVLPPPQVQFNAVAWAKRDEVWWPVFLCDPRTLRSNLFHLGTGELPHCRVATGLPFHNRIAYYFGMHDFGLYADDSLLKRWFCSEHVSFIKGHVDASVTDRLKDALKQVQEFFVAEEGHRTMLCKLVGASDDVSPPPPQLHSFVDGARVVPESHQVVLALYRPSSNPTRKAMLDDGAADKAPYDVLTMHTTRFKPTDLDALNQIMNAANPQRPADEKHGLTPMLPFLSDQVDVTEVQVPNEDIDAAVVQVLHNLVDAIAQYHAATSAVIDDRREAIEEVDTPTPLVQTDKTHEATPQEDSDANDMQEPDESHRSIQYAMDDIVASIEAIQCEDQEIEAIRSAAKTDDGAMFVGEGDWCVDMNSACHTSNEAVPFVTPWDVNLSRIPPTAPPPAVVCASVAWSFESGSTWWPVYLCDPDAIGPAFCLDLMRQDEDGSSSSSDSSRFEDDSDDEEPESCDTEWEHSDHDSPRRTSASVAYAKETKGVGRSKSPSWFATPEKHPSYPRGVASTQGITTTSSPDPPASRSRTRGPITSVGIPRTAHVWKHFVWEEHMGKYYNYKLIECRYCRQAYADRGDRDVPVPERVVSQIPKMKLHLLQCAHCQLTEDDLEPLQKQGNHRATVVKAAPSRPPEDPRPGRALRRTLAVDDDVDEDQTTISATREEGAAAATIEPVAPQGPLLVASTADGVDIPSVEEPGANDDDAASNSFEHQVFAPESPRQPDPSPIAKVGLKKASPGRKKRKASHVIVVEDDSDTLSDESVASYTARHPVKKRKGVPAKTLGPRTITLSDADKARMTKQRFIFPPPPQLAFGPHLSQDDALREKEVPQPPIVTASPEHVKPPAPSVPVTRKAVAVPPAAPVAVTRKAVVSVPPTPALPTNVSSDVPVTKVSALHDTIVWAYLKGYPWVPAYVLNPFKLRSELHLLGNGHERTLKKAKQKPGDYCIIYYFGTHNLYGVGFDWDVWSNGGRSGLITTPATALRPWHCDEHAKFLSGFPKAACKGDTAAELVDAIAEAEYLSVDAASRVLPEMHPSDMNPLLDPPSDSESGGADSDATVSDGEDIVHGQPKRKESCIVDTPKQQITPSKKESPAQPKPSEDLADDIIVIDSSESENDRDDNSASSEDEPDSSVHSTSSVNDPPSDVEDDDYSTAKKNAHTRVDAIERSRTLENDVEDEEQSQVEDSELSNDDGLAPVNSDDEVDKDDEAASVRSDDDEDGGGGSWEGSQGQAPDDQDELEALEDLEDAEYFTNDDDPGEDDPPDGDVEDQDDGQSGGDEDKQSSEDDDAQEETLNDVVDLADDSDPGHCSEEDAAADADVDDDNQSQEDELPIVASSNQRRKRPNKMHGLDNTTLMKGTFSFLYGGQVVLIS
ncbi:hypothetical protein DYB35_004178 [Aphanomyces astaci]|uniref:PWWP domain-containing protein n=1 Tax=Aphanomyces astaci TaxID=112090 RepID=A0A418CVJ2_APHAT|nr:hypothetical protein DYB35_004178 [Aphanomyces astaci]